MSRATSWLLNLAAGIIVASVVAYLAATITDAQRRLNQQLRHDSACWDERYGQELPPVLGDDC